MKNVTSKLFLFVIVFSLLAASGANADAVMNTQPMRNNSSNIRDNSDNIQTSSSNDPRVREITQRLNEIKAMDLKKLSRAERRELRHEVKEMKKEMAISGGVYISVGALLLIILLLLLL